MSSPSVSGPVPDDLPTDYRRRTRVRADPAGGTIGGMRRADRLFQIVGLLHARRVVTAATLAEELSVSIRAIYRDVADLIDGGTPIEGEAGVGYRMARGWDLPPLTFDREEVEALVVGVRMAQAHADPALADAARRALVKIEAAVPPPMRRILLATPLFAPARRNRDAFQPLESLRTAIGLRRKVALSYVRKDGERSTRVVRPVGLYFWGQWWSLAAWCELRQGWRSFRLDRADGIDVLEETYAADEGTTLEAYARSIEAEAGPYIVNFRPPRGQPALPPEEG